LRVATDDLVVAELNDEVGEKVDEVGEKDDEVGEKDDEVGELNDDEVGELNDDEVGELNEDSSSSSIPQTTPSQRQILVSTNHEPLRADPSPLCSK